MGRSGSGLCPTRNRPDQIGSPNPGPVDGSSLGGRMSTVRQSGIGWFQTM